LQLGDSKAGISTKHALAITNRGGATSNQVIELARFVQERVAATFGINLIPEPSFITS
jgi:UDP-N-acetylmuramate dehydrogenase